MTTESKPKTLAEVVQRMSVTTSPILDENEGVEVNEGMHFIPVQKQSKEEKGDTPTPPSNDAPNEPTVSAFDIEEEDPEQENKPIPEWVSFPPKFKIPSGRTVLFIRLRAKWTDTPKKGDRVLICWPLNDGEEDRALDRTRGKGYRVPTECTKGMIRAIDGKHILWPGVARSEDGEGVNIESFWRDIGSKCRSLLEGIYLQTHRMQESELFDFFQSCMDSRTVG